MSSITHIQLHAKSKPTSLYNNNDYLQNAKSYFTSIEPNKNQ